MNHRRLFLAIEVNLILWIIAGFRTDWDAVVVVGLILSAVVQHWAYYSLVRAKEEPTPEPTAPQGSRVR